MTVKEYIDSFNLENDNPYDNEVLLKHINVLEQNLDVMEEYKMQTYARVLGESQYALPVGVDFEDVYRTMWVNGVKYKKRDVREYKKPHTFWYEDVKLCIYPACAETDNLTDPKIRIVYRVRPNKKLMENIETDTLYIPDRFIDVYDHYLTAKIAYLQKEYADYKNAMDNFNSRLREFEQWWGDNKPSKPESEIVAREEGGDYATTEFDSY